jgi:PAS domain S-box-containing protein
MIPPSVDAAAVSHRLIDAILAVNEAPTFAGAFQALAEAGVELLGADSLWVVVRHDDLRAGEIVAGAGPAAAWIGSSVPPTQTDHPSELTPSIQAQVRVPLLSPSSRAIFHAAWDSELDGAEEAEATQLLQNLTRLTTLAEQTLRQRETAEPQRDQLSRETLRALFDAIPTAIGVSDPRTQEIITVNRAFCELVERPLEEIIGAQPPYPWWGEGELQLDADVAHDKGLDRLYRSPDGHPTPVHLSLESIPGGDGKPALTLALIEDLAEERRVQQQLVQSGKLAAIGELAAGVAHEINNPLFAILGLTEFLLKESETGSKAHARLELIQQTGLEIKEIVRALLDFARENAEERHVVSLEDVVRSTVDLVRRTNAHKGVELVDAYDSTELLVSASSNQLKQIFLNLIANARQAMPEGGTVSIEVRRVVGEAVVTVAVDGPGIPADVAGRIFEPFFTTKRLTGGTGLGLSVSLGIAEGHGGRLTVASEPGVGSTFTLSLPIADESTA